MGEKEAIEILQYYLDLEEFVDAENFLIAIKTILKLYKQEKQKNIRLQKKSFNDLYHIKNDNGIIKIGVNK